MKNKSALIFLLVGPAIFFSACQKSRKPGMHLVLQVVLTEAGPENSGAGDRTVVQVMAALKERMSEAGAPDAVILRIGAGDKLLVQIPDPKNIEAIERLLRAGGNLEMRKVEAGPFETEEMALKQFEGILPSDLEMVRTNPEKMERQWYVLQKKAVIANNDIQRTGPTSDMYGSPAVSFMLTAPGGEKFRRYTSANIGTRLSIVLDNRIISVAAIQDTIGSEGIIQGRFTSEEVQGLVSILRSPLPLAIRFIEKRTVFPVIGSSRFPGGGALIRVSFNNSTTIEEVQSALKKVNLQIAGIQQIGEENSFFILIRDSSGVQLLPAIAAALMTSEELAKKNSRKLDLNNSSENEIAGFLIKKGMAEPDARALAQEIIVTRMSARNGMLSSKNFSANMEKIIILKNHTFLMHFAILNSEKIWAN